MRVSRRKPSEYQDTSCLMVLRLNAGIYEYAPLGNAFCQEKAREIENLLGESQVNVLALRQQAITHGGLISVELRRKAWPVLLDVDRRHLPSTPDAEAWKRHRCHHQVLLDVPRSRLPSLPGMSEVDQQSLRHSLEAVIMRVLMGNPELHYYQGFNDICLTLLLVMGEDMAVALAEKLAVCHLRGLKLMVDKGQCDAWLFGCLNTLLQRANPQVFHHLKGGGFYWMFIVSWMITWFSHDLTDLEVILRLFDFFIACHPLMSIYVTASMFLSREKEILATEQELGQLYPLLKNVSSELPFEHVLTWAGHLYMLYPPTVLCMENYHLLRIEDEVVDRQWKRKRPRRRRTLRLPATGKPPKSPKWLWHRKLFEQGRSETTGVENPSLLPSHLLSKISDFGQLV